MPSKGGASGKFGDQYESLWTVDAAMRVITGNAEFIVYESLDPEASRGVEFNVQTPAGTVEFWSLKRQTTTAAGWTLATLVKPDDGGRSILGDLVAHVERDVHNIAVFASALGAAKLEELRSAAATADILKQRLNQSTALKAEYDSYLLPLFGGDQDRARQFLTRVQVRTSDETSLRTKIESTIALLFYNEHGGAIDPQGVRRLLAEFLLNHMNEQIDGKKLIDHLASNGIRRMDWKVDCTVREKVSALCDEYTRPLHDQLIGGALQTLPGAEKLLGSDGLPVARRTLLSGGAGGGKSTELAYVVERLRSAGIPTLPIRMDAIPDTILTPQKLASDVLSLHTSPVAILAGLADGANSVLVIDQLDAVSLASGRRTDVWTLFERILVEADGYPNLRVIVACRAFDLEHDHRMRALAAKSSTFETVTIDSFKPTTVDSILGDRKVHAKLKPLLVVPLHLAMFLSLATEQSERLETRDQLFGAFWSEKQRTTTQRLGRTCNFAGVIDWLATWLSDHQELSAPENMLPDEIRADADALTSEHVIVLSDGRYRFFHETFFDYAFARRFVQRGGQLIDLLLNGEQHLFRRAQVRQILSFLRANDQARYIKELQAILTSDRVRFHVKRVVFQYLSAIPDPAQSEWAVLRDLLTARPDLTGQVNRVISNHAEWFDALNTAGFFDAALSNGETKREQAIWLCAMPEILQKRPAQVATLLVKYRRDDEAWRKYLQYICRTGNIFHSREIFDLFLSLVRDGTLDGTRPGFAVNDNWWSGLYSVADKKPALGSEAIAAWFDRKLISLREREHLPQQLPAAQQSRGGLVKNAVSRIKRFGLWFLGLFHQSGSKPTALTNDYEGIAANETDHSAAQRLRDHLEADGDDHGIIAKAAEAPLAFAQQLLPRVANLIAERAKPGRDRLETDPLWSFRTFGDHGHSVYSLILSNLARALEKLAKEVPAEVDRLLTPYVGRPHDTIAYLVLRAWTAAPDAYAERLAKYLIEDPRRLKIGYASWSGNAGGGMASGYRSIEAVRTSSTICTADTFKTLEAAIVTLTDDWESTHPQTRGLRQLQLLTAMDQNRLGPVGRAKLEELKAKFPKITHDPPEAMMVSFVGSPIPDAAQEKMTDDQWISAMTKYAGVEHRHDREFDASGGEHELARSLEARTKADPKRFVALSARMPTVLPSAYFDAIIMGVAGTPLPSGLTASALAISDVVALVELAHTIPGRPCGRWIAHLLEKWSSAEWPPSIIEAIAWYATEDPDPSKEIWQERAASGQFYNGGDPDMSGLNSTRGAVANAIGRLLFEKREPGDVLRNAVEKLAHDASIAVRSQAVFPLLALLNTHADLAIKWFIECVSLDPILLKTRFVEQFLYHAAFRDYAAIRPVLQRMTLGDDTKTVQTVARLCCVLALGLEIANEDAKNVREGSAIMRESAADVYATNVANEEVGEASRELLLSFFTDPEDQVRSKAARAFREIGKLEMTDQSNLLRAFLDAKPNAAALEHVIRAIEDSPVKLPDLVCRLVEAGIQEFKTDAGDVSRSGAMVAVDLSKIVIRLYTQSDDEQIKRRCLDAIDDMELAGFFGLADELGRIDR
jgi:hypothetical protein